MPLESRGSFKDILPYIRGNVAVIAATLMIFRFSMSISYYYITMFLIELGADYEAVGIVNGIALLAFSISCIIGGYLADIYGRYRIIVVFTYLSVFASLIYVLAPSWHIVALAMVIDNIVHLHMPAVQAILADSIPVEKRGLTFSSVEAFISIPSIAGPALSGFLYGTYGVDGIRMGFIIFFVTGITAAVLRQLYLKETLTEIEKQKNLYTFETLSAAVRETIGTFKASAPTVKLMVFISSIYMFAINVALPFYQVYALYEIGLTPLQWGIVGSIAWLSYILAGIPVGLAIDKAGRRIVLVATGLLMTVSALTFISFKAFILVVIASIGAYISTLMGRSASVSLITDYTPRKLRGRIHAIFMVTNNIASVPGGFLSGILYEMNPKYPFLTLIIIALISSLLCLLLKETPVKEK